MPSDLQPPAGFQFAAVRAGLKASGKPDLAIAVADQSASAAAMFTQNRVVAAPIVVGREHLGQSGGRVKAVLVNSGNANCATGDAGISTCRDICAAAAAVFACEDCEVFPSSTGIIGVPLPGQQVIAALAEIPEALGRTAGHFLDFAQAILTTDTGVKISQRTVNSADGAPIHILGCAKGAGMIHPQLAPHATMLAYLFTDAAVPADQLSAWLREAVEVSFHRISIDGDTSTNDTVLLLASGASGAVASEAAFQPALSAVCIDLARQIVADGEGATHLVELDIEGAATDQDALKIAKSLAHSPLVKTAWAGNDPNWGRLMAAIGASGAAVEPGLIAIWFGEHEICRGGGRSPDFDEEAAHRYLSQYEFQVRIRVGDGRGRCRFWTCDLTKEYVAINADYST